MTRRPARPLQTPGTSTFSAGRDGALPPVPPESDIFPIRVTSVLAAGPPQQLQFIEQWLDATNTYVDKVGGRENTASDPAIPRAGTFAADDFGLCRRAPGAGGLRWEVFPLPDGTADDPTDCSFWAGLTSSSCLLVTGPGGSQYLTSSDGSSWSPAADQDPVTICDLEFDYRVTWAEGGLSRQTSGALTDVRARPTRGAVVAAAPDRPPAAAPVGLLLGGPGSTRGVVGVATVVTVPPLMSEKFQTYKER